MLILLVLCKTGVRFPSSPQIYLSMVILLTQLADLNKNIFGNLKKLSYITFNIAG